MDHILEPNSEFDFSQISIISPTSLSGGNYFLRMLTKKQEPLYIQPPKCFTKQGIITFSIICLSSISPTDFISTASGTFIPKFFKN